LNDNGFRVNPNKGSSMPEMNNKEIVEYDQEQLKNIK